jgi:hypothetical protein
MLFRPQRTPQGDLLAATQRRGVLAEHPAGRFNESHFPLVSNLDKEGVTRQDPPPLFLAKGYGRPWPVSLGERIRDGKSPRAPGEAHQVAGQVFNLEIRAVEAEPRAADDRF